MRHREASCCLYYSSSTPSSLSKTETYYDSQSGLHLPVHNEQEIQIFLNISRNSVDGFSVPQHLYKSKEEAYEMKDQLRSLTVQGIHGLILPPFQFPRDSRNKTALSSIVPPGFFVLYSQEEHFAQKSTNNDNCSLVLSYGNDDNWKERLENSVKDGKHTTLQISEEDYQDQDAIAVANDVASVIDGIGGGCDFIWLSSSSSDESDKVVEICEELVYLDVAGPTIKSRMLIESLDEDVLEDCMFAGVNKFVTTQMEHLEMIEEIASSQGKNIVKEHQGSFTLI
jgi:hypothetical protein